MNDNSMKAMFSSNTDQWATPIEWFNKLNDSYNFNVDVCADDSNHKCDTYFTKENNGLINNWMGTCFMNPPYGKDINKWIEKAFLESIKGSIVVCLIPARTDTRYFQDYCMQASDIYFIRGRLKFGDSTNSAPFPSCIVVFNMYEFQGVPRMHSLDMNTQLNQNMYVPVYMNNMQPILFR